MAEFPALPLWTDAYLADTLDLNAEQHGCYLILLMIAWRRQDCAIPNDMAWLKRSLSGCIASMHGNRFNSVIPKLLLRFFTLGEDGKYRQKKLGKTRDSLLILSRKNKENADKRWRNADKSNGSHMRSDNGRNAIQNQNQNQSPPTPPEGGVNRYANGHGKRHNGSNGLKPLGGTLPSTDGDWRLRVETFQRTGSWVPSWGPKPGEDGCEVPAKLVNEILGRMLNS